MIQKTIYLVELPGIPQEMPSKLDQSLIKIAVSILRRLTTRTSASTRGYEIPPGGVRSEFDFTCQALCAHSMNVLRCQQGRLHWMMNLGLHVEVSQTQSLGYGSWHRIQLMTAYHRRNGLARLGL